MTQFRVGVLSFMLVAALPMAAANVEAATIYVNAKANSSGADGTSWKTAFVSLQSALDEAALTPGADEIWMADGTYVPSKIYAPGGVVGGASGLNTPHLKTFDIPDHVAIYGGFSGNERSRTQRSSSSHGTILSGGGVSWHVVTAGNDIDKTGVHATLQGLAIRDGNAAGPAGGDLLFAPFAYSHDLGGGLYVAFDSAIGVTDVQFVGNSAAGDGGGLFSINSMLTVDDSLFSHNAAITRAGALEVLDTYETSPHVAKISGSVFDSNTVQIFGGAIVGEGTFPNDASMMDIDRSTFTNNTALEGGAIVFDSQKSFVRNSRFDGNAATVNAGALATTNVVDTIVNGAFYGPAHVFTKFTTTVLNCDFTNNVAHGEQAPHDALFGGPPAGLNFAIGGGALVTYMNGYMNVIDSRFRANVAEHGDGGAILNGDAEAQNVFATGADAFDVQTTITGSTFTQNSAPDGNGGAVASLPGAIFAIPSRTVANTRLSAVASRFTNNSASTSGGGVYLNATTAILGDNAYEADRAAQGDSLYAVDSIVNGDPASPVVK